MADDHSDDHRTPSRRAFLGRAASILAAPAALAAGESPAPPAPAAVSDRPAFFTAPEWAFLNAACGRLIPEDELGAGALTAGVPHYVDAQMATAWADGGLWYMQGPFIAAKAEFGNQSALTPKQSFRLGIRAADDAAHSEFGKPFAALEPAQQDDMLKRMEKGAIAAADIDLKSFFALLLKTVQEGFFGDPLYGGNKDMVGWKLIGHPGVRADYLEWVGMDGPYPYGPVSLYGKRG